MGHHYVPQAYLAHFADPADSSSIWMLPRGDTLPRLLPIKVVAQSPGFYEQATEEELARLVETPANPLLDKLRASNTLNPGERLTVAVYLATMLKRIPKARERAEAMIPDALTSSVGSLRDQLTSLAAEAAIDEELLARRLQEIDAVEAKFRKEPPAEVIAETRDPRPTANMVEAVYRMTWRILVSNGPRYFLTSDNPAFFHGAYGIGTDKAELRFPLSTTHALHGTWTRDPRGDVLFYTAKPDWVMEFNRSLASQASTLVFYHRKRSGLAHSFIGRIPI